jgi:hypothetical protein
MFNLLSSAINNESNKDYSFFLRGDLCQMTTQRSFLSNRGFDLKQNNVYPCLKQCDVKNALTAIWTYKPEGWWHYVDEYVEYDICTKEDFLNSLKNH